MSGLQEQGQLYPCNTVEVSKASSETRGTAVTSETVTWWRTRHVQNGEEREKDQKMREGISGKTCSLIEGLMAGKLCVFRQLNEGWCG